LPRPESMLRGASATLIASVLSIGLGLLLNISLGRVLGPDIKGRIDLIIATIGLSVIVFGFSVNSGVTYVVARGNLNLRRLGWQLIWLAFSQGLLAMMGLWLLAETRIESAFIPHEYKYWGGSAVAILATMTILTGYWRAILAGLQRFVLGATLDIVVRLLLLITSIIVLWWAGSDYDTAAVGVIAGLILVNFIALCMTSVIVWPLLNSSVHSSRFDDVARYSISAYGANLVQFANYRLDVFLVAFYVGIREVALYTMAVNIAQLLWLPSSALQTVLFPRLASFFNADQRAAEAAQVMRLILFVTILGALIMGILAPWGMTLLFGIRYSSSIFPFWLLLPGITTFCVANVLCGYLAAIGKPQLNLLISLSGLFVTLSLDFALVPHWGMIGAAIASSTSYFVSAAFALYFFKRESGYQVTRTLLLTFEDIMLAFRLAKDFLFDLTSKFH
jgi:stage V sporulation protein B